MKLAACWIEQQTHLQLIHPSILICTDSMALCSALLNPTTCPIQDLHRQLCSLTATVNIQWVPAHVNVPGNELADQAAKDATQLDEPSVGTSYGSIKQWIKWAIQDPPISHQRTRETYEQYSLKCDEEVTSRADQVLLAQLRSGHHKCLRAYQHRLYHSVDPHCVHCPGSIHDLEHWLTRCQATLEKHFRLFGTCDISLRFLSTHSKKVVVMARATLF